MDGVYLYQPSQKPAHWPTSWDGHFCFYTSYASLSMTLRADESKVMLQLITPWTKMSLCQRRGRMKKRAFFCYFSEGKVKKGTEKRKGQKKKSYNFFDYVFLKDYRLQKYFSQIYFYISSKTATHKAHGAAINTLLFSSTPIFLHKCFLGDFTLWLFLYRKSSKPSLKCWNGLIRKLTKARE